MGAVFERRLASPREPRRPTLDPVSVTLDPFSRRVLEITRDRAFDRSPREYSGPELDRLVALYRQAPLRHERDADTNIRLAYLFLAADLVHAAVEESTTAMAINPRDTESIVRAGHASLAAVVPVTGVTLGPSAH